MGLVEVAEGLGIDVDGRWGEERLQEEIDKARALQAEEMIEEEGEQEEDEQEEGELFLFRLYWQESHLPCRKRNILR